MILTSHTLNSFGYLAECVHFFENRPEGKNYYKHPEIKDISTQVSQIIPYLCDIAEMHCYSFMYLIEKGKLKRDKESQYWYYANFGMPQVQPFSSRDAPLGLLINGHRRALLFEAIVHRLLSFFQKKQPTRDFLLNLDRLFRNAIDCIFSENKIEECKFTFRKSLEIKSRA